MADNSLTPPVDRRVRRTRAAIQNALTELILEKGYDSVTVTDIIDRADIGRSTFYAHFTDKSDVFDDTIGELADFLRGHLGHDESIFAFSLPMFEHIVDQRLVVQALFGRDGHSSAMRSTSQAIGRVVLEDLASRYSAPPRVLRLVTDFVVGAYFAVIGHWITEGHAYSASDLDHDFRLLVTPGVQSLLGPTTRGEP